MAITLHKTTINNLLIKEINSFKGSVSQCTVPNFKRLNHKWLSVFQQVLFIELLF